MARRGRHELPSSGHDAVEVYLQLPRSAENARRDVETNLGSNRVV